MNKLKNQNNGIGKILPVLFGFFVMGFCDVVGISTSYVKIDFNLSETLAGFIPSMVFLVIVCTNCNFNEQDWQKEDSPD